MTAAHDMPIDHRPPDGAPIAVAVESACPKCRRASRPGDLACARCGLLVARFARFAAERDGEPEELDRLWGECRDAWDQPAAHDRLLDGASRLEQLPALGRRYRAHRDERPDD